MRLFTRKVLEQLNDLYNYDFVSGKKELLMALFMQLFSYNYDDAVDKSIKFKNISDISSNVWVNNNLIKKTNEKVGIPIFLSESESNKFYSLDLNSKTEYILNETRGSIVHSNFLINDDGTIMIRDKFFNMTFEFDCIVDICNIISNEIETSDQKRDISDFILFVEKINQTSDDYNKSMLKFKYDKIKFPIIFFNLLPMNEEDMHNNQEYINHILELIKNREYYKKGKFKNYDSLKAKELYKIRNCITHFQYYFNGDDFILYDHKDTFVFDCEQIEKSICDIINQNDSKKL